MLRVYGAMKRAQGAPDVAIVAIEARARMGLLRCMASSHSAPPNRSRRSLTGIPPRRSSATVAHHGKSSTIARQWVA